MSTDKNVPQCLHEMQEWFGSIITNPLTIHGKIQPTTCRGQCIKSESEEFIVPSKTLEPYERMQIYNQGYWWRLITLMQEAFPLTLRILGYDRFNVQIAIPYLINHPPNHWDLNTIWNKIVPWIRKNYPFEDKTLILAASKIDFACEKSFFIKSQTALDPNNLDLDLAAITLKLQPHIQLFKFASHLFQFRQEVLEHPVEYWLKNDLPMQTHEKPYYFVLYRTHNNQVEWKEISQGEYLLLKIFQKGSTIEQACGKIESLECFQDVEKNIANWFQDWTLRAWLITALTGRP